MSIVIEGTIDLRQACRRRFACSAANRNLQWQALQTCHDCSGARAQFVFGNLKERECRNFARYLIEMKIDRRLQRRESEFVATERAK